jgi:hypothetical protein
MKVFKMNANELLKEIEKENKMREGNISLILDSYNDLFSDFDPRSYTERALSDDFLIECKRAARDKEFSLGGFVLRLLVPKNKRNTLDESKIKQRIKYHFQKHFHQKEQEIKSIKKEGMVWFAIGVLFMVFATIVDRYSSNNFLFNLLFVILEPAGWFTAWSGLDKFFFDVKKEHPEYNFYKKMASAEILFIGY